jgi:hypothetical protein
MTLTGDPWTPLNRIGRCLCEIQVRTSQQHLWAEIVERLADRWGRQIRYGGQPDDPQREIGDSTRLEFWNAVVGLSDTVHRIEEVAADQNFGVDAGAVPEDLGRVEIDEARRKLHEVLAVLVELLDRGVAL